MGRWLLAWILCVLPIAACSGETAELVGSAGGTNLGAPDAGCAIASCASKLFECGNCLDDDHDDLFDEEDPDCLGPCDNSENGF